MTVTNPKTKTIVVDRQRWGRGEGLGSGLLANRNRQNCCCLGFLCNQAYGITWNELRGKRRLGQLMAIEDGGMLGEIDKLWSAAMAVNDHSHIDDREGRLTRIFADQGFTLEFIN